jgi:hypothetical protein
MSIFIVETMWKLTHGSIDHVPRCLADGSIVNLYIGRCDETRRDDSSVLKQSDLP